MTRKIAKRKTTTTTASPTMTKPTTNNQKTISPSKVSFDPGWHTGIAVTQGKIVVYVACIWHEALTTQVISSLLTSFQIQTAIVEGIPVQSPDLITTQLFNRLTVILEQHEIPYRVVSPGNWKPFRTRVEPHWTPHIKDAVEMSFV